MNQEKKFKKKKLRERESQKKVLARRHAIHVRAKREKELEKEAEAVRVKPIPIRNEKYHKENTLRQIEIKMQIEKNMEILKGLDAEYQELQKNTKCD